MPSNDQAICIPIFILLTTCSTHTDFLFFFVLQVLMGLCAPPWSVSVSSFGVACVFKKSVNLFDSQEHERVSHMSARNVAQNFSQSARIGESIYHDYPSLSLIISAA